MSTLQPPPDEPPAAAVPAVIYAAKSTEDVRGSIPTQVADCREAVSRERRVLVAEPLTDEAASAYHGNRGPGLAEALRVALDAAEEHGEAEVWVQHSDRLARGDGRKGGARHLGGLYFECRAAGVRLRSVQNDADLADAIRVALAGEMSHGESERKSAATRAGKRRQLERGRTRGPLAYGYRLVPALDDAGQPIVGETRRGRDDAAARVVERIFDLAEAGRTDGEITRELNADGIPAKRGGPWERRAVRQIVTNGVYAGWAGELDGERVRGDHPALIDPDRFERIQAGRRRMDPVQVAARAGGRKPAETWLLRGIAHCGGCGAPMYTRTQAVGRVYVCKHRRTGSGVCHAPPVPAEPVEAAIMRHLDRLMPSVERWIADLAERRRGERSSYEQAVYDGQRAMGQADHRARKLEHDYEERVMADDPGRGAVLRMHGRAEADRDAAAGRLERARARLGEFDIAPSAVDHALDFFREVGDVISRRIAAATSAEELHVHLRDLLAGIWLRESDQHYRRIECELALREPASGGVPEPVRMLVSTADAGACVWGGHEPDTPGDAEHQTFV